MSADSDTPLNARVQGFLDDLAAEHRTVATAEWGLTLDCGGWPLHIGLAIRSGLLRAQAEVLGPDRLSPSMLLHHNRRLTLVRFAHSGAGGVWIHGELPVLAVTGAELDRLLGLLVEAATWARQAAVDASSPPA